MLWKLFRNADITKKTVKQCSRSTDKSDTENNEYFIADSFILKKISERKAYNLHNTVRGVKICISLYKKKTKKGAICRCTRNKKKNARFQYYVQKRERIVIINLFINTEIQSINNY